MEKEIAAFEAGIKLGAAYHQWIGVQLSPGNLAQMEQAIKSSLESMPYVVAAKVEIDASKLSSRLNRFGYCELSGDMLKIQVEIRYGRYLARACLESDASGYPMMKLLELKSVSE